MSGEAWAIPDMTSSTLYFGPWYRKSPFFEATLRWGCTAYDVYNHMYRLLTLDGWGHVALSKSTCIATYFDRYLVTGALPPPGTTCRLDQQPFG